MFNISEKLLSASDKLRIFINSPDGSLAISLFEEEYCEPENCIGVSVETGVVGLDGSLIELVSSTDDEPAVAEDAVLAGGEAFTKALA